MFKTYKKRLFSGFNPPTAKTLRLFGAPTFGFRDQNFLGVRYFLKKVVELDFRVSTPNPEPPFWPIVEIYYKKGASREAPILLQKGASREAPFS